jgi:hypothetical protein
VLYLGEINSLQAAVLRKAIEVLDDDAGHPRTVALFPEDRASPWHPMRRWSSFACRRYGCAGHANGAPVGWPGSCGRRCSWSNSGPTACRRAAKVHGETRGSVAICR